MGGQFEADAEDNDSPGIEVAKQGLKSEETSNFFYPSSIKSKIDFVSNVTSNVASLQKPKFKPGRHRLYLLGVN